MPLHLPLWVISVRRPCSEHPALLKFGSTTSIESRLPNLCIPAFIPGGRHNSKSGLLFVLTTIINSRDIGDSIPIGVCLSAPGHQRSRHMKLLISHPQSPSVSIIGGGKRDRRPQSDPLLPTIAHYRGTLESGRVQRCAASAPAVR